MIGLDYRAWNKEKEIMVYNNEDDSADYWDGVYQSDISMINAILNNTPGTYDFMQYTGLKDKNGKKIYEGDIIKIKTVKINEDDYVIDGVAYNEFEGMYATNKGYIVGRVNHRAEVIGNIYENKDLLED